MSSDSSCEDENECFREAIDPTFLTESLYNNSKKEVTESEQSIKLPSLRNQDSKSILSTNPYSIHVTPEFQKHVAKHLSKILDQLIVITENKLKTKKRKPVGGVKLLRTSKDYVLNTTPKLTVQKRFFEREKLDYDEIEQRAKQVAVSGDWVLSQKETEHWAKCSKGLVEIVKNR
ncbi:hypothetical protein RUM43_010896 [Polyplax serrata]|uniref:Protein CUSTOS n=1 Tax=Polyplax serrata TaxID=468196 RepID=A0AAN8NL34_POLSC